MMNNILLPGGGLEFGDTVTLSHGSMRRVDRAAEVFHTEFMSRGGEASKIYCTGAYPSLPAGVEVPPHELREGALMADELMNTYQIPANRIEVETESASTAVSIIVTTGMIAAHQGVRVEEILSEESHLGIVTRAGHIKRISSLLGKLGCDTQYVEPFRVDEGGGTFYDAVSLGIFKASLIGVHHGEIDKILKRDSVLESVNDRIRLAMSDAKKLVR